MVRHELKLKVKLGSLDDIRPRVREIAKFVETAHFVDGFFNSDKFQLNGLRVRRENHDKSVSVKILKSIDRLQENSLYEFACDPNDFVDFLEALGFVPSLILRKKSEIYECGGITIELADVEGIGSFIELIASFTGQSKEGVEGSLFALSERLGLPQKSVELRFYSHIS